MSNFKTAKRSGTLLVLADEKISPYHLKQARNNLERKKTVSKTLGRIEKRTTSELPKVGKSMQFSKQDSDIVRELSGNEDRE